MADYINGLKMIKNKLACRNTHILEENLII